MSSQADFAPGDLLRGKYRIKRIIGKGGMGVVVRATHLRLNQDVAIKILRRNASTDRFAREARAAAQLRSDHAVRILDVDDDDKSDVPFIVMEYLEGADLEALVKESGPLPAPRAIDFVLQACIGLAEAHALGIVHRDVKPANLFLAKSARRASGDGDRIKVLDYGISMSADDAKGDENPTITKDEHTLGSPAFMSPEQLKSAHDVDARTDVWALGVVLFFLLTGGELPFAGPTATAVTAKIASDPPRSLRALSPDLPPGLIEIVERCLEKDRDKRFASIGALASALAPFAPSGEHNARRVSSMLLRAAASAAAGASSSGTIDTHPRANAAPTSSAKSRATTSIDAGPVSLGILTGGTAETNDDDAAGQTKSVDEGERDKTTDRPPRPRSHFESEAYPRRSLFRVSSLIPLALGAAITLVIAGIAWRHRTNALEGASPSSSSSSSAAAKRGICSGVLRVRVLYDKTGVTQDVGLPGGHGVLDHLRMLDSQPGGLRGCRIEIEEGDTKYDPEATRRAVIDWTHGPHWRDVSTVFGQGTPPTQAINALITSEKKLLITTAFSGELASPQPVEHDVGVPTLNPSFIEATVPVRKRSPGYPFVFFQGSDYTTSSRVAMSFLWQRGAKRVGFMACSTTSFCTDPIDGAKTFLHVLGGTKVGRDLSLELDESEASIEAKLTKYIDEELAHVSKDPSYAPIDWIWFGNTRTTLGRFGRVLAKISAAKKMSPSPKIIANSYGLDEHLFKECGEPCVGVVHGVQPYPTYGDTSIAGMNAIVEMHDRARTASNEPLDKYATTPYVSGYIAVATWRAAVEAALDAGDPITGETLKRHLEELRQKAFGDLATISYSPTDHRPQSSARIYVLGKSGRLEHVARPPAIALQADWLGW